MNLSNRRSEVVSETEPALEQIQSSRPIADSVQGGFFLRKKPRNEIYIPYSNSESAVARPFPKSEPRSVAVNIGQLLQDACVRLALERRATDLRLPDFPACDL
jgi:hypothetical protein